VGSNPTLSASATAPLYPIFRIDSKINELSPGKPHFLIVGSEDGSSVTALSSLYRIVRIGNKYNK
jgi:hypothetical protein